MKVTRFSAPGKVTDLDGSDTLKNKWSAKISGDFTANEAKVQQFFDSTGGGARQIYNPLTHAIVANDETQAVIVWNGFPKRALGQPGQADNFAGIEPNPPADGAVRAHDEYLEWWVERDNAGKIVSVQFTCEGWDYWDVLGREAPDLVVQLYKQHISPQATKADLFKNGTYDRLNVWNTERGAMHLTHSANNLFAEITLASDATVRRTKNGQEVTAAAPLIDCADYGDGRRNSDPKIGVEVNQLARKGAMITLADPVGLYMNPLDDSGWKLSSGAAVQGVFRVLRGAPGFIVRAECRLPQNLAAQGATLSDVRIGGVPITFGGQIAQRITMKIIGTACRFNTVQNGLAPCGALPSPAGLTAEDLPPTRGEA